jgi:hypothetical protein
MQPNKPLKLTPLYVERDRGDFDSWNRPERFPDLCGAAQLSGRALGCTLNIALRNPSLLVSVKSCRVAIE